MSSLVLIKISGDVSKLYPKKTLQLQIKKLRPRFSPEEKTWILYNES